MDFDVVLEEVGEFGKFQLTNYLLICLPVLYGAANSLSYVFTAKAPNYRCFIPQCDSQSTRYDNEWVKDILPGSISESQGHFVPENCMKFSYYNDENANSNNESCPTAWFDHSKKVKCDSFVFDENERTIVNDWNLTCSENEWKLALVGTMHFAGIICGSGLFGFLADKYGRKRIFIIATIFMSLTGIGQAVSTSYITFLSFAFLNAVGTSGVYPLAFVIGVEMVGKRKREMAGVVLNYFYSVGEALVGIIAWIDADWVRLQYWISVPPLLFISYHWLIPESIRWLIAKKSYSKALHIIYQIAEQNGKTLSSTTAAKFDDEQMLQEMGKTKETIQLSTSSEVQLVHRKAAGYRDLVRSKILLLRSLLLFFIWATNAFVYYGLSLHSINLSGNIYLNFILGCLIEIPGNTVAWIIINKIGRRLSLSISLLICGIMCISGGFVPEKIFWIQIILFLVGKMAITSSFTVVYVYSAEMLPTLLRSGVVGVFSTFSRFFSLLAPFVPLLKRISHILPLLVFGAIAFIAGMLALLLPETMGTKLPETIEEAENIGKKVDITTHL